MSVSSHSFWHFTQAQRHKSEGWQGLGGADDSIGKRGGRGASGMKGGEVSGGWKGCDGVEGRKALGLSLVVGKIIGRDMMGLAGGRKVSSLSLSLASSLPEDAVREVCWEEVRTFSGLGWEREVAATVCTLHLLVHCGHSRGGGTLCSSVELEQVRL